MKREIRRLLIVSACGLGIGLNIISFSAMAQATTPVNNQSDIPTVSYFSPDKHFYFGASASYEYFKTPNFHEGSPGAFGIQDSPIAVGQSSQYILMPTITAGFHFDNAFLSSLFGQEASVELNGTFFNKSANQFDPTLSNGAVWAIDGSGPLEYPQVDDTYPLSDFSFHSSVHMQNVTLNYRGERVTSNPHLTLQPSIGLVYISLDQNYSTSLVWTDVMPILDTINESVNTKYYGIGLGNNLNYQCNSYIDFFANIQVQLLKANSTFTGNQVGNQYLHSTINVQNSNQTYTYRAMLMLGSQLNFTSSVTSPYITVSAGVDQWGYMAEVHNPAGTADTAPAHIVNEHELNPVATVGFVWPLA